MIIIIIIIISEPVLSGRLFWFWAFLPDSPRTTCDEQSVAVPTPVSAKRCVILE